MIVNLNIQQVRLLETILDSYARTDQTYYAASVQSFFVCDGLGHHEFELILKSLLGQEQSHLSIYALSESAKACMDVFYLIRHRISWDIKNNPKERTRDMIYWSWDEPEKYSSVDENISATSNWDGEFDHDAYILTLECGEEYTNHICLAFDHVLKLLKKDFSDFVDGAENKDAILFTINTLTENWKPFIDADKVKQLKEKFSCDG